MTNTRSEKAAHIMKHYGAEKQLTLLCEECAELIQAACKCRRRGVTMHEDMIEEMADVAIMLMQFEMTMNRHELDSLDRIIGEKLDRQIGRIENEDRRSQEVPQESGST